MLEGIALFSLDSEKNMKDELLSNLFGKRVSRRALRNLRLPPWEREAENQYQHLQEQKQMAAGFFSGFGNVFGIGGTVESYEAAPTWARHPLLLWAPGQISSAMVDPTNSPTTTCRPGLVLGQITASGLWTNYSPTATDGSQVAQGVLGVGLPMLDPFTNLTQTKVWGIIIGGPVQSAKLIGLDLNARAAMSPYFRFDDNYIGNYRFPWQAFVSKTTSYQVLAADNGTLFDNVGAVGAVTFTLPAIANGYFFGFRVQADQSVTVASLEGSNIVGFNLATASSVAFSTGSAKIGGQFILYSNPAGTKWIVETASAGANTVTTA